ncbi:glycoside hydrolase family 88 protein [Saccharicrinis sp. FJH54]|uniref:glycoside hydrolase family 88 protein n=1 Tax=Saccharicrinis sp. FJH54 TaxID=3344665 RepID=UPI0035D404A3
MKIKFNTLLTALPAFMALMFVMTGTVYAQQALPDKAEVIATLKKVNNYWISTHPDPGDREWANAVYFTGNLDYYQLYPKQDYLDYAISWAEKHNWELSGGTTTVNADQQCAGQSYIELYKLDGETDETKIAAIDATMTRMVNRDIYDSWWWIDALYMAMPGFAKLGLLHNDTAYFEQMYKLYNNTKVTRNLYNTEEGLWYRDESFLPEVKLTPNGQDIYWSRGNGWVFAAHTRILKLLPEDENHRDEYLETFIKMAQALVSRQREDGLWNPSLDDPEDYGGPETSGTSFFTYGLAWGINAGILDSATYYPVVQKAWNGLTTIALHDNGYVGYIQGVGSQPSSSQPVTFSSNADFGVGAFLMAGTEVVHLAQGSLPQPSTFFLDSVAVLDHTHIELSFTNKVDMESATNAENYTITGDVQVLSVSAGSNDSSVVLEISPLDPGSYSVSAENVYSESTELLEPGEFLGFIFSGEVSVYDFSGYQPNTTNLPENTLDFNFSTRWSSEGIDEWIIYDLGEQRLVESLDIAFYNGNTRKAFFAIEVSDDGENFTEVFNGESNGVTPENEFENFDFDDVKARYVKYHGFGNSSSFWNSVTEVKINYSDVVVNPIESEHAVADIKLYPNPTDGSVLTIDAPIAAGRNYLEIYDVNGSQVHSGMIENTGNGSLTIRDINLFPGLYTVQLNRKYKTILMVK